MALLERLTPGKYALRVDDYVMLAAAGAFGEEKTELIDGDVIVMAPEYRPHAYVRDELAYRLRRALEAVGSDLFVGSGSIWVSPNTMPQPDIVLTREPRGEGAVPLHSIALLVEVSSTTLSVDLGRKQEIYAASGIPEYWVVEVSRRVIHQKWRPTSQAYGGHRAITFGDTVEAATIEGLMVNTGDL